MKNLIASLLLVVSLMSISSLTVNSREKTDKKHRYGEKILVIENKSTIY